jgi:hypothetical protein
MRSREDGDTETIRAAHRFVARHDELRAIRDTGAYQDLEALLDGIDRQAAGQVIEGMAAKGATQTSAVARDRLVEAHMRPIASIARLLEEDHPELQAVRMPNQYRGVNALITHAIGMAAEASKWKDEFVDLGLPADFVEELHAAAQRFKEASARPGEHRAARHGAKEGAETELEQAKRVLKVIDSFVRMAIPDNPALLAEWKVVKRFPPRKKKRAEIAPQIAEAPPPLLLSAPATPLELTAGVVEEPRVVEEPAKRPARWTLRGLFRT